MKADFKHWGRREPLQFMQCASYFTSSAAQLRPMTLPVPQCHHVRREPHAATCPQRTADIAIRIATRCLYSSPRGRILANHGQAKEYICLRFRSIMPRQRSTAVQAGSPAYGEWNDGQRHGVPRRPVVGRRLRLRQRCNPCDLQPWRGK